MQTAPRLPSVLGGLFVLAIAGVLLGSGSVLAAMAPAPGETFTAVVMAGFFLVFGFPLWIAGWRLFVGDVQRQGSGLISPLAWIGLASWVVGLGCLALVQARGSLGRASVLWGIAGLLFLWGATRDRRRDERQIEPRVYATHTSAER